MDTKICGLFAFIVACFCAAPIAAQPTLWNEQIDYLLMWYDYATSTSNYTTVSIPNMVTENLKIRGVKLGNMATLTRFSDVYMEEPKIDDMKIYGSFSLGKFKLYVDDFRYKNYVGSANFTSKKNSVKISYTLIHHTKPGNCKMDWETFQLAPFKNVVMYSDNKQFNNKDITEEVNTHMLPELNKYMNSAEYKKILNHVLDFCFINIFK